MKKNVIGILSLVFLFLSFTLPVLACDENHGSKIKVQAPIETVTCDSTPATITMFGGQLNIDISNVRFDDEWASVQCEEQTCANLEAGQMVKVELASDIPVQTTGLLVAKELESEGWDDEIQVRIAAPLQKVDGTVVTVLGLPINIATATLFSDEGEPITLDQIKAGQLAKIVLDPAQLPSLVATKIVVHIDHIKVKAPIYSKDCEGTPATITLFGGLLTIDISKIDFEHGEETIQCEEKTCADLDEGQMVMVKLASDVPVDNKFTATKLKAEDCDDCEMPEITAPIQTIEISGTSIVTVLGLPIDITNATVVDDNEQPSSADKLAVGQFVEIELASSTPPLVATKVEAQSPVSQVEVKLLDKKKRPMTNIRDIRAEVTVKGIKKALSVQNVGSGAFLVAGLPQGKAKIAVTGTQEDGQKVKGSASVKVKMRNTQQVSLRLKPVK